MEIRPCPDQIWLNRTDHWPKEFYSLLDRFGTDLVWSVGLHLLGYPPTWSPTGREFVSIKRFLFSLATSETTINGSTTINER